MREPLTISLKTFAAYLNCPTKAYLLMHGEIPPSTFFADTLDKISAEYKIVALKVPKNNSTKLMPVEQLRGAVRNILGDVSVLIDGEKIYHTSNCQPKKRLPHCPSENKKISRFIPVLFSPWERVECHYQHLINFAAISIQQITDGGTPSSGKFVYGKGFRTRNFQTSTRMDQTRRIVRVITSFSELDEPPLCLNKHCKICDYQTRCKDLPSLPRIISLLESMTEKERSKCREKGISTITQLSYGYRPRRKKHVRKNVPSYQPPVRPDNKLKALAIKKRQIHVVGTPSLPIQGTPFS